MPALLETNADVARLFPATANTNVDSYWPLVKAQLKFYGVDSEELTLYALATIRAETTVFSPAAERPSQYSRSVDHTGFMGSRDEAIVRPFGAYDSSIRFDKKGNPVINKQLGNRLYHGKDEALMRAMHGDQPLPDYNDGERYRGRGFIQLTGKYNYEVMQKRVGRRLHIDLVANPELASDPETAARVLACFLSLHKSELQKAMADRNYAQARRVVNHQGLNMEGFMAVVNGYYANKKKLEELQKKANLNDKSAAPQSSPSPSPAPSPSASPSPSPGPTVNPGLL